MTIALVFFHMLNPYIARWLVIIPSLICVPKSHDIKNFNSIYFANKYCRSVAQSPHFCTYHTYRSHRWPFSTISWSMNPPKFLHIWFTNYYKGRNLVLSLSFYPFWESTRWCNNFFFFSALNQQWKNKWIPTTPEKTLLVCPFRSVAAPPRFFHSVEYLTMNTRFLCNILSGDVE